METFLPLIGYTFQQLFDKAGPALAGAVVRHFTDHSTLLYRALERSVARAWQALGVALGGDGWLGPITRLFAGGDDAAVRKQIEQFLADSKLGETPEMFRKACLAEWKRLGQAGGLSATRLDVPVLADAAGRLPALSGSAGLVEGAQQAMAGVADALKPHYPNLAQLLRQPAPGGIPLLAAAFAYFFRREVVSNPEIGDGLLLDGLAQLSKEQARGLADLAKVLQGLEALGGRLDDLLNQVGEIGKTVGVIHGVVLDLQIELERQAGRHGATADELRGLMRQVLDQLGRLGMQRGEIQSGHSGSIRSEDERRAVRALLARFRQLPAEQQQHMPALLNGLGKLQVGAGAFEEARQTFAEVARIAPEDQARAEASYNAYRAALEQKHWDDALRALAEAVKLDGPRFAPFPLKQYRSRRILGAGGFGVAFLCKDAKWDEDVVVKTLHADELDRSLADVEREAKLLRQLKHEAIIGVRDYGIVDSKGKVRPYLVMDYFAGDSLQRFVDERGPLELADLRQVAGQIAAGMKAVHDLNILHRDLKPDNVLIRKEGDRWLVKIIDFGLSLRQQTIDTSLARNASAKTLLSTAVVGTVEYAPPEQMSRSINGKMYPVGRYSDIYAFGKLCCFAHFRKTQPFRELFGLAEADWRDLLLKCIEEDPSQRHASFEPVLLALLAPKAGEVVSNSLGMKFAWIPPGTFLMGSPREEQQQASRDYKKQVKGDYDFAEEKQHRVTLSQGFYLSIHPVTQAHWQAVMGSNPSHFKGDNLPVENVSWDDCQEFCKKLSQKTGKLNRLPTEAEWEYACRAGTTTPFHFGSTVSAEQANYDGNYTYGSGKKGQCRPQTTSVGSFPANPWGLFDMHGNVFEWCQDWYGDYPSGDVTNPKGENSGAARVLRGGSWGASPWRARSAYRGWYAPGNTDRYCGVRVVFCLD